MAQEVLKREQAELQIGRGTVADVAEATQRLEQFNLDLVTRTSDVITTERQLRNLLGLPPADNRQIIPVTPPNEERVEFDWDTCLNEMMEEQPDIVQQKVLVRVAELQLLIARNQWLPPLSLNALDQLNGLGQQFDGNYPVMISGTLKMLELLARTPEKAACSDANPGNDNGFLSWQTGFVYLMPMSTGRSPLANSRQAQYILLRSHAYLQQILHQTTHSLARFFLEVDADYKQYRTAARLRKAAAERLDAQRAYYEEGRITIDRFLDSVSQYATAVATEAQYKSTYNIALAALAEAKGTLLADRGIKVAEGPHPRKAYIQARDIQASQPQQPVSASGPVKADGAAQPAKPTPPRWAEVTQVTRRAGKRDLQAITASFEPDRIPGVEVPRIVSSYVIPTLPSGRPTFGSISKSSQVYSSIHLVPPAPRLVVSQADAAFLCSTSSGYSTPSETATTKAQPACTNSSCATGSGSAKIDTACITAKAEQPAKAKAKTWTFSISIGGTNPWKIQGTITQTEANDPFPTKP